MTRLDHFLILRETQVVIREEVVQRLEEFDKYKPVKTDELL